MRVKVVLYGMLREKLAKESRGRVTLDLDEGSTIQDAMKSLGINPPILCVLNGVNERDSTRTLKDGDEIQFFHPIGGGIGIAVINYDFWSKE